MFYAIMPSCVHASAVEIMCKIDTSYRLLVEGSNLANDTLVKHCGVANETKHQTTTCREPRVLDVDLILRMSATLLGGCIYCTLPPRFLTESERRTKPCTCTHCLSLCVEADCRLGCLWFSLCALRPVSVRFKPCWSEACFFRGRVQVLGAHLVPLVRLLDNH